MKIRCIRLIYGRRGDIGSNVFALLTMLCIAGMVHWSLPAFATLMLIHVELEDS